MMKDRRKLKDRFIWLLIGVLMVVGIFLLVRPMVIREQRKAVTRQMNQDIEMMLAADPVHQETTLPLPDQPSQSSRANSEGTTQPHVPSTESHSRETSSPPSSLPSTPPTSHGAYPTFQVSPDDHPMPDEEEVWLREADVFEAPVTAVGADKVDITIIGQIEIPSVAIKLPILDNADYVTIRYGPGRYVDTHEIGEAGNAVIFGHRMNEPGEHFHNIGDLQSGASIYIHKDGLTYTYRVSTSEIIAPTEIYDVMFDHPDTQSQLILATCDPYPTWENYLLVYADLVDTAAYTP